MRNFDEKSFHKFATDVANEVNEYAIATPAIIKNITAPLLFGINSHAAIAKMKSEAKTPEGVLHQIDDVNAFSHKLSSLAEKVKLQINYQAAASDFATELLNEFRCEYQGTYQDGILEFVEYLKQGLSDIESFDAMSSSIKLTGCNTPSKQHKGCEVYNKQVTITVGTLIISLSAVINVDIDNGSSINNGWCMQINSFDYTDREAFRSMTDLFPAFGHVLESEEALHNTHYDLAKVEEILVGQLLSSFEDIDHPRLGISAEALRNIVKTLA